MQVVNENRKILLDEDYSPLTGFPTQERTIDSVVLIIENTCLFGDLLLHMPDMAYTILSQRPEWRAQINWALAFVAHFESPIFDAQSRQLLSLTDQEINVNKRTADYINPYGAAPTTGEHKVAKAKSAARHRKKKLPKGPQLGAAKSEL